MIRHLPLVVLGVCLLIPVSARTNLVYVTYHADAPFNKTIISNGQILEAQSAQESLPEQNDPAGHWGESSGGFRLSLRFAKASYTNGEPVLARILLRNVSDKLLVFIVSDTGDPGDSFAVFRSNEKLRRRDEPGPNATLREKLNAIQSGATHYCESPPHTQREFVVDLTKVFDLGTNGQYIAVASREVADFSHHSLTNVTSSKASFMISP